MSWTCWVLALLVMVATALGVFGNGILARARAGNPGGPLWVEYDRVARFGASVRLIVHAQPQPDGSIQFTLDRSLLEGLRVQHVTPSPASTPAGADGAAYRFEAATPQTAAVTFDMQPATRWLLRGEIRSPTGDVRLSQLILP